jgi:putative pyruvate formate lyase activating enzyme
LNRRLRPSEGRNAREYMENLGLHGFVQEDDSAQADYIPPFDLTGV